MSSDIQKLQKGFQKLLKERYRIVSGGHDLTTDEEKLYLENLCMETLGKSISE